MMKKSGIIFHNEIAQDTYQLCSSSGYEAAPGKASRNSYLIVGKKIALLFDLALKEPGIVEYAEQLSGKPTMTVLSHAHADHIFGASALNEVWLHKDDATLLRKGSVFQKGVKPCPKLNFLNHGDILELGERNLKVFHIPGHTDGSILLYDENEKLLFSGDTVTRRLLYGLHTPVPITKFCDSILALNTLHINGIFSAHDRVVLPKEHIDYMADLLFQRIPVEMKIKRLLYLRFRVFSDGDETSVRYFDFAQLLSFWDK